MVTFDFLYQTKYLHEWQTAGSVLTEKKSDIIDLKSFLYQRLEKMLQNFYCVNKHIKKANSKLNLEYI